VFDWFLDSVFIAYKPKNTESEKTDSVIKPEINLALAGKINL